MIVIGLGAGVAPLLGFLRERRALGHTGPNWLFYGEAHAATDFYYRDELEGMHSDALLTRISPAFVRDRRPRVDVADLMDAAGAQLWRWPADGAHVYVCGAAGRTTEAVHAALQQVARDHGELGEAAAEYVQELSAARRYLREVY